MDEIIINNTPLSIKEYEGKRVVTFKDIDMCHKRPEGTARKRFNDNKKHFVEGEDFYKVCASEIRTNNILNISDKCHQDVVLITESGYYMLVKSFTDDLSWDVQRQLVNSYFRVQQVKDTFSDLSPQLQYLIQMEQRQKQLEARQQEMENKLEHMQEDRKELIKATLDFGHISYSQQKSIAKAAKLRAIQCCYTAQAYDKIGKRVIFSIYNALQEKFHVASYRDLCMNQMVDALAFIEMWEPDLKLMNDIAHASPKPNLSLFES